MTLTARRPRPRSARLAASVRDGAIAAAVLVIVVSAGFSDLWTTSYWSRQQIFQDFMNSSMRLLFPVAVALLAGWKVSREVAQRFLANTRTRADIRRTVTRRLVEGATKAFVVFAVIAVISGICAFVIAPAVRPEAIDPAGYNLMSAADVRAADAATAPLSPLLNWGVPVFLAGAAVWSGLHAAVFGALTVMAVLILRRPAIALLAPLAIYLLESATLQFMGLPGPSFLLSAVYPSGLTHYDLAQAVIPIALLGIATAVVAAILVARSPTASRFS